MKQIFLGSDHAGFALKEKLKAVLQEKKFAVTDMGSDSEERCDYPDFAQAVAKKVAETPNSFGLLVCGTGIGMSMAANKINGIRAAVCWNEESARLARAHNNANVLCVGARMTDEKLAEKILETFLQTEFEQGRHADRIDKIKTLEE